MDPTQHMQDLKALAEKDPEFFKYLQENDAELLNFEGNTNVEEDEEMSDDEEMEEEEDDSEDEGEKKKGKGKEKEKKKGKKEKQPKKKDQVLTKELLKTWQKNVLEVSVLSFEKTSCFISLTFSAIHLSQTRSFKSLRKLLIAFRSAAQHGSEVEMEGDRERYEIQSPAGTSPPLPSFFRVRY